MIKESSFQKYLVVQDAKGYRTVKDRCSAFWRADGILTREKQPALILRSQPEPSLELKPC